jgi:VIT1/CCC1 family predicted Fe2+/Mn2+ transporter
MRKMIEEHLVHNLSKLSYGSTAATTTSLALIIGLHDTASARMGIIGALLVIAIADNISDSLSIHMYRESECSQPGGNSNVYTISNFFARLLVTGVFIGIVAVCPMHLAVILSVAVGFAVLTVLSYLIARHQKTSVALAILHHLSVAAGVMVISYFVGHWISNALPG